VSGADEELVVVARAGSAECAGVSFMNDSAGMGRSIQRGRNIGRPRRGSRGQSAPERKA